MATDGRYQDLVIPRCRLYLAEEREDGTFGPEKELGNCPEVSMTTEVEEVEAPDAGSPTRRILKRLVTSVQRTVSLTAQEMLLANLTRFLGGDATRIVQAASAVTDEPLGDGPIEGGAYYQLGETTENPSGVRGVSDVVLHSDPDVTYEAGKDYEVDTERGRVYIPAGSACVGETVLVDYDLKAVEWDRIATSEEGVSRRGRLRIVSHNAGGRSRDFFFPLVEIRPEGDLQFTSESDWQSVAFVATALSPEDAFGNALPSLYVDGKPVEA